LQIFDGGFEFEEDVLLIFFDQVLDFLPVAGVPKIVFQDGRLGESNEIQAIQESDSIIARFGVSTKV